MRTLVLSMIMALLVCTAAGAATLSTGGQAPPDGPVVGVKLLSQSPDPVYPGNSVELRFLVQNNATGQAEDLLFELRPDYPFVLEPGDNGIRKTDALYSHQVGEDAYVFHYRLTVSEDTVAGTYNVRMRYSDEGGESWSEYAPFKVRVDTRNPIVGVTTVESDPGTVAPGDVTQLELTLKNYADAAVKNVQLNLLLMGQEEEAGLPFAPMASSNQKVLEVLDPGEERAVSFDLMAEPQTNPNIYKVPYQMIYEDADGKEYTRQGVTSISVGQAPDLLINMEDNSPVIAGQETELSVRFTNKGLTEAKLVTATFNDTGECEIVSPNEVYVDNIDSDDYEITDFRVRCSTTSSETVSIPMHIAYLDANNKEYTIDKDLDVQVYTHDEAVQQGLVKENQLVGYLIAIGVVVVGFILYRIVRRSKR